MCDWHITTLRDAIAIFAVCCTIGARCDRKLVAAASQHLPCLALPRHGGVAEKCCKMQMHEGSEVLYEILEGGAEEAHAFSKGIRDRMWFGALLTVL